MELSSALDDEDGELEAILRGRSEELLLIAGAWEVARGDGARDLAGLAARQERGPAGCAGGEPAGTGSPGASPGVGRRGSTVAERWSYLCQALGDTGGGEEAKAGLAHQELVAAFRALFDSTDDFVFAVDSEEFRLILFNRAFEDYFREERGIQVAAAMATTELVPTEALANRWIEMYQHAIRDGVHTSESTLCTGARTLEFTIRPMRHAGRVFALSVFGRDVTRQHAAEQATRASEGRFGAIFEASPLGISLSRHGTTVLVNPAFAKMMGCPTTAELLGRSILERVAPSSRDRIRKYHHDRFTSDGAPEEYEGTGLRKDGTEFPFLVNVSMLNLPDGPAAMAFFRDLTEQRKSEEQRARIEAQLRHAQQMEAIGTLAAGFAHDFNNVLAPILGLSSLALANEPPDSPAAEDLSAIYAASKRAKELVRQILSLSRSREGAQRAAVELVPIVKETVRLLQAAIPAGIEIQAKLAPECPSVIGDGTELHQVLLNLCTNARDAMAETGGSLTITLRRARPEEWPARQRVGGSDAAEGPGWVLLSVRDSGCGMNDEIQRKIFDPYFTTKPRGKGTGLGLAVTRGIVASLGGEIRVTSAPGRGATFEVLLPGFGHPASEAAGNALVPRGQGERVVIVDDEPAVRSTLMRILTSLGYQPVEVASSHHVLPILRAAPRAIDAIIMDQTMPGIPGLELAGECLAISPDLPILLCTGDAELARKLDAKRGQVRGILRKPFTIEEVAVALRGILEGAI